MINEGMIANDEKLLVGMRQIGHLIVILMDELLALMEYYCDSSLPLLSSDQAQVLVGTETPAAVLAKCVDRHYSIHRPKIMRNASSDDKAATLVIQWLRSKLGQILGLREADINLPRPAYTYRIDSLVSIDWKNWFAKEIGSNVQVFMLLGDLSLEGLGREAAVQSRFRSPPRET